jgi:hypothetical protein
VPGAQGTGRDYSGEGGEQDVDVIALPEENLLVATGVKSKEEALKEARVAEGEEETKEREGREEVQKEVQEEGVGGEESSAVDLHCLPALFLQNTSTHHLQGIMIGRGAIDRNGGACGGESTQTPQMEPPVATPLKDSRQYPQSEDSKAQMDTSVTASETETTSAVQYLPLPHRGSRSAPASLARRPNAGRGVLDVVSVGAVSYGLSSSPDGVGGYLETADGKGYVEREDGDGGRWYMQREVGLDLVSDDVLEVSEKHEDADEDAIESMSPGREEDKGPQLETETETETGTETEEDCRFDAYFASALAHADEENSCEDAVRGREEEVAKAPVGVGLLNVPRVRDKDNGDSGSDANMDGGEEDNEVEENVSKVEPKVRQLLTRDSFVRDLRQEPSQQDGQDFQWQQDGQDLCRPAGGEEQELGASNIRLCITPSGLSLSAVTRQHRSEDLNVFGSENVDLLFIGSSDPLLDPLLDMPRSAAACHLTGVSSARRSSRPGLMEVQSGDDIVLQSPLDKMLCERAALLRMDKGQQVCACVLCVFECVLLRVCVCVCVCVRLSNPKP